MNGKRRRPRTLIVFLVCTILIMVACALYIWGTVKPAWLPIYPWLQTVGIILAVLAVAIPVLGALISDIVLPFIDRSAQPQAPTVADLLEQAPVRRVDYPALVARLGRSGMIPWIDRGITTPSLLQFHGRIAVLGPMKSGKTREAIELIRMAQENGLVSAVFEPTATLDLIEQEHLSAAVAAQVDQRCLLLIDDLGVRQDEAYLERQSLCIASVARSRPDAYFIVTLQQERLSPSIRSWLEKHRFHAVTPPVLTADQRLRLAETGAVILNAAVTPQAVAQLGKDTEVTKPWDIVSVLQAAPARDSGKPPLTDIAVQMLLARGEQGLWAEQRREIGEDAPAAQPLLRSIGTFFSAGVTPRQSSILRYAGTLMPSRVPEKKKQLALRLAAESLQRYDIIASDGLYTIPEPRLLPLLIETEQARASLKTFAASYRPGFWTSLVLTLLRSLEFLFRPRRSLASRFRFVAILQKRWKTVTRRLPSREVRLPFRFPIVSSTNARLSNALFEWPADQALLQLELGSPYSQPAFLSSTLLADQGRLAMKAGAYRPALEYCTNAIALNPTNAQAFAYRGLTFKWMGQYEKALLDFDRAITLKLDFAWVIARRADTLRLMGRYAEALTDFDRARGLEPDSDDAIDRGLVLSYLGRYGEALEAYRSHLGKYPGDFRSLYNTAVVTVRWKGLELGQPAIKTALAALESADGGEKGAALYGFGGLAALRGDSTQALDYLRQAIPLESSAREWAQHDIAWLDLRSDPGFQALLASEPGD